MARDMAGEHIGLVLGDAAMPDKPLLIRKVRGMSDLHWRLIERSQRLHHIIHPSSDGDTYRYWEGCQYEPCKGDREAIARD